MISTEPIVIEAADIEVACRGSIVQFDFPAPEGHRHRYRLTVQHALTIAQAIVVVVGASMEEEGQQP